MTAYDNDSTCMPNHSYEQTYKTSNITNHILYLYFHGH